MKITLEYDDVFEAIRHHPKVTYCKECYLCEKGINEVENWCWCQHWQHDTDPDGFCYIGAEPDIQDPEDSYPEMEDAYKEHLDIYG